MRKLLLFFVTSILLVSCSSGNDDIDSPPVDGKKYEVKFEVKSEFFQVEEEPLKGNRAGNWDGTRLCQVVAYKESGESYASKVYLDEDLRKNLDANGQLPMSLELPKGNYHIAIVSSYYNPAHPQYYQINPQNYNTDYFSNVSVSNLSRDNRGMYYETFEISISETSTNTREVVLQPMWSTMELILDNVQDLIVPEGTMYVEFRVAPVCLGFYVKSKLPKTTERDGNVDPLGIIEMNQFPAENQLIYKKMVVPTQDLEVSVVVNCLNREFAIIHTKELAKTNIKNATNYKVSGNLGNITNEDSSRFGIKLGEFTGETVEVPFL